MNTNDWVEDMLIMKCFMLNLDASYWKCCYCLDKPTEHCLCGIWVKWKQIVNTFEKFAFNEKTVDK